MFDATSFCRALSKSMYCSSLLLVGPSVTQLRGASRRPRIASGAEVRSSLLNELLTDVVSRIRAFHLVGNLHRCSDLNQRSRSDTGAELRSSLPIAPILDEIRPERECPALRWLYRVD